MHIVLVPTTRRNPCRGRLRKATLLSSNVVNARLPSLRSSRTPISKGYSRTPDLWKKKDSSPWKQCSPVSALESLSSHACFGDSDRLTSSPRLSVATPMKAQ